MAETSEDRQPHVPGPWLMWAGEHSNHFRHFGQRSYVEAYGDKPVRVVVTATADGPYWGWLQNGAEAPDTIYLRENQFLICFPYGPPVEYGRVVRLYVQRAA